MAEPRARVRVFVTTFRRPQLLRRALASLRAQTLGDWVCELHNDDPADLAPGSLLTELDDPRIHLVTHSRNLGAVATFNLVFQATNEPYYSLLEDDNWWAPTFLAEMVATLDQHAVATVAWCNQQVWQENRDGSWSDTGQLVQPGEEAAPRLVDWGDFRQALGAVHANGAMLVRSRPGQAFQVEGVPFTAVEAVRERLLPHPLVYVPQPLAIYALTQVTSRRDDRTDWFAIQCVLLASYVRNAGFDTVRIAALWNYYRAQTPAPTNVFICAALICRKCRPLLREARWSDWFRLARSIAGHPVSVWRALRVRHRNPSWWTLLDRTTAAQWSATRQSSESRPARPAAVSSG